MIKVLIQPIVFIEALKDEHSKAFKAIQTCQRNPLIQAWVSAGVTEYLLGKDATAKDINPILAQIAQVPINAKLSGEALKLDLDYDQALAVVMADCFNIDVIIGSKAGKLGDFEVWSPEDALNYEDDPAQGNIDFLNLKYPLHPIFNQVDGWFMEIMQNTAFAGGTHVNEFEKEFAAYQQTKEAVGVSSGTDALLYALLAMGVGPGDEVITQPNTFIATTEAISQAGATIVFVDVDKNTALLDPSLIEAKITKKTKVILPVHLYGQISPMEEIKAIADKHGLMILEDACQAHGAELNGKRAGHWGSAAAFSMYPGKNLGAFGEAGAVVCNDSELAAKIKMLREHGQSEKYYHQIEGYNGRMDNFQAASVRAKLPLLDSWNARRREIAHLYSSELGDIDQLSLTEELENAKPAYHLYVVQAPDATALHEALKEQGIFSGFHYPMPLHLQEAYKDMGLKRGSFPVTERLGDHLLSLPMFPELTDGQVDRICKAVRAFYD